MELRSLLPLIVAVLIGIVVLRILVTAVRYSSKVFVWGTIAAALFGLGYLWYQNLDPADLPRLPDLNIPAELQLAD